MKQLKFNAEMAQAVKDGRKTQSRRPMKPQPIEEDSGYYTWLSEWGLCIDTSFDNLFQQILEAEYGPYKIGDSYDVDGTLIRITNIRVERLQDISEEDAIAEGLAECEGSWSATGCVCMKMNRERYETEIWDKLPYQPPYDWNSNPYVWVVEFEVLDEEVKEAQEKFEKSGVLVL